MWFKKRTKVAPPQEGEKRVQIPEGLWVKCLGCREIVYKKEVDRHAATCPKCQHHFRIGHRERINLLIDPGTFRECDAGLSSTDPLSFRDSERYSDRLRAAQKKSGLRDPLVSGRGAIDGRPVQLCVFEFAFMGGSMGSVTGEKITRAVERALEEGTPVVLVTCSGGARMQESTLSLMQMAKTSIALAKLSRANQPYVTILTDPTTGGVTASVAMLGDVIMAEPGALIGFAGPRVIEQTIKETLPEGFQRAEFLLEHGLIDMVVHRCDLKRTLSTTLDLLC